MLGELGDDGEIDFEGQSCRPFEDSIMTLAHCKHEEVDELRIKLATMSSWSLQVPNLPVANDKHPSNNHASVRSTAPGRDSSN